MALTYPQRRRLPTVAPPARTFALTYRAPVRGWVTNKNIGNMRDDEALVLDNMIPRDTDIQIRGGNSIHATGVGTGVVSTVMGHNGPSTDVLLAAGGGKIYDATLATAAVDISGASAPYTSDRWQHTMVSIVGSGNYTLMVNGSDTPQKFDGSTITDNVFTGAGLDPLKLIDITLYKFRVFAIEKASMRFWHLQTVNTIAGAMSPFDLGPLFKMGGYLVTMATWTRDGGTGPDDFAVFITSRGEVAVFSGANPADSNDWSLVGVYRIGAPLGQRCTFKYGSDVVILTQDGFLPISRVLSTDRTNLAETSISARIQPTVNMLTRSFKYSFGWQGVIYPTNQLLVVNVPTGNATNVQTVMNTNTGAWCRFTGLQINSLGMMGDQLYFGDSSGNIWKFADGIADDDQAITARVKTSFQYFGSKNVKRFNLVRPVLQSDGDLNYRFNVDVDFKDSTVESSTNLTGGGTPWDEGAWDTFGWGDAYTTFQQWRSPNKIGTCAALKLQFTTGVNVVGLVAVDWKGEEIYGLG